jgi:hypothetical protein
MRTGAIIGSALAGAAIGAIATMEATERTTVTNYLSGLWEKVPSAVEDVLPKNLRKANFSDVRESGKAAVRSAVRKTQRFANAGRTGDVKARGRKGGRA